MFSLDMNKQLWKDETTFYRYLNVITHFSKDIVDKNYNAKIFLEYANQLDDIMQEYEKRYGTIEDPIFYWSFAASNALFLLIGKEYDEMGAARVGYVVNGHIEGLNLHQVHPSFPGELIWHLNI